MRIEPIIPSQTDEQQVRAAFARIKEAAAALKVYLEPQGFVVSWLSDSARALIGLDDSGRPVALAFMVFGRRFYEETFTASVLILETSTPEQRAQMLEYMQDAARMLGAVVLLFEGKPEDTLETEAMPLRARWLNK